MWYNGKKKRPGCIRSPGIYLTTFYENGLRLNRVALSKKSDSAEYPSQTAYVLEPVFDARKIVVHTVRVNGVVVVVDGDETNTVLRKGEVGVKPGQRGVAAQSGKVFGDRHGHPSRLDFGQHGLKAGTVIGHTAYTVIHEKGWVGEVMLPGILQKHGLLRRDLSRLFSPAEYKCPTLL